MEHLFLPYELALLAKEKGFDEPCLAYLFRGYVFSLCSNPMTNTECHKEYTTGKKTMNGNPNNDLQKTIVTPLYQQIIEHIKKYSKNLSGGQKQRVAIAEQILNGGDFILLDEPFSGLDTLTIDKVTQALVKIAEEDEHKTIIIVSHDLSNALAISDTAFILSKPPTAKAATITAHLSLASAGLAWQPDIKENPAFRELLKQVKSLL